MASSKGQQKETCDHCKRKKLVDFIATDELWSKVIGDLYGGVFCLNCFVEIANSKNITIHKKDLKNVFIYNPINEDGNVFSLTIK